MFFFCQLVPVNYVRSETRVNKVLILIKLRFGEGKIDGNKKRQRRIWNLKFYDYILRLQIGKRKVCFENCSLENGYCGYFYEKLFLFFVQL